MIAEYNHINKTPSFRYIARFKNSDKKNDESEDENIGEDRFDSILKEVNIDKIESKPIFFPNPSGQWGPQKRLKPKKKYKFSVI